MQVKNKEKSINEIFEAGVSLLKLAQPADFATCVAALRKFRDESILNKDINPVVLHKETFTTEELRSIIIDYSVFLNAAAHMLLDSRIRVYDWKSMRDEIEENMHEEYGSQTGLIPHLEMMRNGFFHELGISTDGKYATAPTATFIARMHQIFSHNNDSYVAGALLAFEGTAIAEFHIIDHVIKQFLKDQGKTLDKDGITAKYVDGHKFFEVGHEEEMRKAAEPHIHSNNMHNFMKGYVAVILTMCNWWSSLVYDKQVNSLTYVDNSYKPLIKKENFE